MDTANLIIDQFGSYLGKHSERLQVKLKGELLAEAPLLTLENVLIIGRRRREARGAVNKGSAPDGIFWMSFQ